MIAQGARFWGEGGWGVRSMLPQEMFCFFQLPRVLPPSFPWNYESFRKDIGQFHSILLGWSVANWRIIIIISQNARKLEKKLFQPFTRFQLGMFYSVIYLFWKIWLVSLKLTLETGVNLKTSSSSGSNHFHTKLRGIYDLLSIIKQTNQANSCTREVKFFVAIL